MAKVKAVFLDRDGVLNSHLPERYVENPDQLVILPGVAAAVKTLNDAGVLVIVISNQQGVARGIMTVDDLDGVTNAMKDRLESEAGATLDSIYYCVHHRADGCSCRKPKPGMILDAFAKYNLAPGETAFVGDSATDIEAAGAANVGTKILVLSGANHYYTRNRFTTQPDYVFATLGEIVRWLLEEDS
ncbi:MAG TPA: HAD family hydrolase [Capsulimonadaceae bacterium]|jgi:D-glycero-D-manno-heptose 1,7-bisphosphate phosphatase